MKAIAYVFLVLFALAALIMGFVVLVSVNPMAALILVGVCVVVGVPSVLGIGLLVVIAGCGGDWAGTREYYDWNNMPALKDRWPLQNGETNVK